MIGSRLLFSGYGIGFKAKPLHAGFLGQDVLLVHDEAHLEPAFQTLLNRIKAEQERCHEFRKLHVMALTATSRESPNDVFELTVADFANPVVAKRYGAPKSLVLHPLDDPKRVSDHLVGLALQHQSAKCAVIVFARTVDTVEKVVNRLQKTLKNDLRVTTLTGTMRGKERDELVASEQFSYFSPDAAPPDESVYLVCTSAGEVGVNISARHLVCDLSTFESMAQRFGRVNRFGNFEDTRIDVVGPTTFDDVAPFEASLQKTWLLLGRLNGDASPRALASVPPDERQAAFAPLPNIPFASDVVFDSWSLTTIRDNLPGRPPVETFLHGIVDREPPETHVAWRDEVDLLIGDALERFTPGELEDLHDDYPLKPHESLRDTTNRVYDRLNNLAAGDDTPVWIISTDGSVEAITFGELRKRGKDFLNYKTVLLPPSAGGLSNGMLVSNAPYDPAVSYDVADGWYADGDRPRRERVLTDESSVMAPPPGMRLVREIDLRPTSDGDDSDGRSEEEGSSDEKIARGRYWRWYVRPLSADDDGSKTANQPVLWNDHTAQVKDYAEQIVRALHLPQELQDAIVLAAEMHDLGKKRELWQRSIGNPNPRNWLAKSGGKMKLPGFMTDYRHEFGSVLDILSENQAYLQRLQSLAQDMQDLVLHLVAAHHGYARPHFASDQCADPNHSDVAATELAIRIPQRFARLQRKHGRWFLAFLESLLRAADWAASANPTRAECRNERRHQY
jgi:CRISPR-associated endonuclease/helicase Cas3